jgi:hypothetical protein
MMFRSMQVCGAELYLICVARFMRVSMVCGSMSWLASVSRASSVRSCGEPLIGHRSEAGSG